MKTLLTAVAIVLALPAGLARAAPQLQQPSCNALEAWAGQVNAETFNAAPRLPLPKAFDDATMIPLFGASVLSWTPQDFQAANLSLTQCFAEAGKRRDATTAGALANANRALQGLVPRVSAALQKATADAEVLSRQLAALPDSPDLARGLTAELKTNPLQPDVTPFRTLPREIGDPLWRLAAQVLPFLADANRAVLFKTLDDRRAALQAGMASAADKAIAGAPSDAGGLIDLMAARDRLAAIDDASVRARLDQETADRMKQIGDTLRQAKPAAWIPPACVDLYRWSAADGANASVPAGGRNIVAAFLDVHGVPVFGVSVADWTDQDVAHFKTLRGLCQSIWQAQAAAPGGNAAELVRLATRGRWIDGADPAIADARVGLAAYRKAREALAATLEKVRALPDAAASMPALLQLAQDPAQTQVTPDDRTRFVAALNEKRAAIVAQATRAAIDGIAGVKIGSVDDLKSLFAYASQVLPAIADPRGQQAVRDAISRAMTEDAARLPPELNTKLESTPATLANVAAANVTLLQLRQASPQVAQTQVFQTYFDTILQSRDAMAKSARGPACDAFVSGLGAGADAKQVVWDGRDGMPLGEFLCQIGEHGTVEGYSGPGMFSSTSTLKALPFKSQLYTVSLHKIDVKPGRTMLVGYKIEDAAQASGQGGGPSSYQATPNGEVTVEGWEIFLPTIIGLNGSEGPECLKVIDNPAPDSLSPAAKVFWLHCWTLDEVRMHVAQRSHGQP